MEHGCNNVTPQEETRGNREYKPWPTIPKYTFYSPEVGQSDRDVEEAPDGQLGDFDRSSKEGIRVAYNVGRGTSKCRRAIV